MVLKPESKMPFHFRGGAGRYEVSLNGQVIGTVERWERRYRLRRMLVTRGWRAKSCRGPSRSITKTASRRPRESEPPKPLLGTKKNRAGNAWWPVRPIGPQSARDGVEGSLSCTET
jgi:hypothetical protein